MIEHDSSQQALWYAWGREDAGEELTGKPDTVGGDFAFGFASEWAAVAGAYAREERGFRPSIRDAFAAWQEGKAF